MLPAEALEEFKQLYKQVYGVELTDAEAELRAQNLLGLYEATYGYKNKYEA